MINTEMNILHYIISCITVPTKPVKNVKISRIDNGRVTISWTPLSYVEARGFPLYTVSYMSDGNVMGSANTLNSSIIIPGLSPHRTYTFTIQVSTGNGTGETTAQGQFILFAYCCELYYVSL